MSKIHAFGEFELDPFRFELRRRGQRVHLQPKVLRLLFHLVEQRERSVSSDELLQVLWPGEVVTLASVRRAVAGARRGLGENADCQSSIQTVRNHGYRFLLPVSELLVEAGNTESSNGHGEASAPARLRSDRADTTFVGRDQALTVLDGALSDSFAARSRHLWIRGEPGVGKTRVLDELAKRARAGGALVWLGRCMEVEGAPPLWPLIQILRAAAAQLGPRALLEAMGPGAGDIAKAVPELRQWLPEFPDTPSVDSLGARFRCFDSMALFLERVSERQLLVLLFDDVQFADASTLRLLAFLSQQLAAARVLFASTVRSSIADRQRAELLRSIAGRASARPVELAGLTECELARYVEHKMGNRAPAAVIARLHERTGGNPLFLEQILHGVAAMPTEEGWLRVTDAPLAGGLSSAIERHLDGLGPECRTLLRAAAVLGREFTVRTLARVVERTPEAAWSELGAALEAGLVGPVPGAIGEHRFSHALIRDALYEELPAADRAYLHGRAGRALEAGTQGGSPALLPRLAEHFLRALPGHDGGRALPYVMRSARSAFDQLAYEVAVAHYDRALELLELGEPNEPERMRALLGKGEALVYVPDASAAREALLEAASIAERISVPDGVVRAGLLLGQLPESGSVDPVQIELIERGLVLLPDSDPRKPSLQGLHAKSLQYSRDRHATTRIAFGAVAASRALTDPCQRREALYNCLHAFNGPESLEQRQELAAELERIGHEHADPRALLVAASARVWINVELGDMLEVDAAIAAVDTTSARVREPIGRWYIKVFSAMRAIVAGRLDAAARLAREAFEFGAKLGEACAHHVYCTQRVGLLRLEGRLAEAERLAREISVRHPALAAWQVTLSGLEAEMGRVEHARAVLDRVLERDLHDLLCDPFTFGALAPAADLCTQVGDGVRAKILYDAILPYAERHGVVSFGSNTHGPLSRHLGRLAMLFGNAGIAERHLKRAISAAEDMQSPLFVSACHATYTHLLLKSGGPGAREKARVHVARALSVARGAGLSSVVDHCRFLAHAAGVSPEVREQDTHFRFTDGGAPS